jgi:hypothetical protein
MNRFSNLTPSSLSFRETNSYSHNSSGKVSKRKSMLKELMNFASINDNDKDDIEEAKDYHKDDSNHQLYRSLIDIEEGYISLKQPRRNACRRFFGCRSTATWVRRFFVIRGKLIFYYADRRSYQIDPQKPLNTRPIDLEGYTLVAGAREPPYLISLIPLDPEDDRKEWRLRCDTLAEFQQWIERFVKILRSCESWKIYGDLVNIAENE